MTKSKFKPILFSTEMVQAILEGRKTMTRRVVKPQPNAEVFAAIVGGYDNIPLMARFWEKREPNNPLVEDIKLKYQIGDILWVRETWNKVNNFPFDEDMFIYKEKYVSKGRQAATAWKWKPSIFMPKEACRIFLKITNVRVERLKDISANDIKSEGVAYTIDYYPLLLDIWKDLWVKINGLASWESNPFVWVIEFEKIKRPENFK